MVVVSVHPMAKIALKILGVKTCQRTCNDNSFNWSCSKFVCNQGVSFRRHPERSHETPRKKYCVMAGAKGELIDIVARRMGDEGNINVDRAKEILSLLRRQNEK